MDESPKYQAGLAVRRAVLGDAYVNHSLANADEFLVPIRLFLTGSA